MDTLVVADARQVITFTLKDANGAELVNLQDSIEEHLARRVESGKATDIEYALMSFSTSAYIYLHR